MSDRINFYRSPIDRELLRNLNKRSNVRGLVQSLANLALYLATTALCLYFFLGKMWILMMVACYVHSVFSSFLGMEATVHELSHKTPFKTRWLNEFFYGLFCMLTWNNPVHFRESHRRHHQVTVFSGKDKEVILTPAPFNGLDYFSWFSFDYKKFDMIMRGNLAYALGRDVPDTFFWDPLFEKDDPKRAKMILWARLQFLFHIILIAVFAWQGLWVLIFTLTCSYFFASFLGRSSGIVQHIGLKPDVPDFRITCHTMLFGPLMSFLYWNMNYHIEHHAYAAVPFFNLKKLHKAMADDCPTPVKGYYKAVGKILMLNRKQKSNPEWCFIPEMPEGAAPARMT
jgi:fatty acid desaturase